MTARHKQAPGRPLAVAPPACTSAAENGSHRSGPFTWEDWFRHAGPQQRALALGLAQQQGVLYPHQLPAVSNGKTPTHAAAESPACVLLSHILAGIIDTLPTPAELTLSFFDADLDDVQQQAVVRALASPDLFALQGLPGTGKSRVLAEIVRQAAGRGWRMLFLAGQTASLDVVLQRLVGKADVLALRFLEPAEKPESLPAWLRGFTLEEQKKTFCKRVSAGACGNRDQVEAACRRHGEQDPIWADLQADAERYRALQERRQHLLDQLAAVERDAQFQSGAQTAGDGDDQRGALAKCDQEIAALAARIAELEPGYTAKKHARFWTLAFWRHLFNAGMIQQMESARQQLAQANHRKESLAQEIARIGEQRARLNQERAAELAAKIGARKEILQGELAALEEEAHRLDDAWATRCGELAVEPIAKTPEAVAAGRAAWLRRKALGEEECQFAHQWAQFVEEAAPQWANRLASFANLLAGSVERWNTDSRFRDAAAGPVDLVLIEDADALSEADLAKLARQGTRCVMIASDATPRPSAGCWQRIWQALGGDAGCWPAVWQREEGRLVCQLISLTAEDRQHLENEGLADAPDIELGILHRPNTRPSLAQVTFGPNCDFPRAFAFMIHEVQEFPLHPLGRTGWWREDARQVRRHLGPAYIRIHAWLDIEAGLRLGTAADGNGEATRIAAIEFDKSAGWDLAKADAWLARHRSIRDHERTAFLQVPYRFQHPLAKIVSSVVRCQEWLAHTPADAAGAAGFEFIPVPAGQKGGSAGLELDLAAPRSADRLPTGLRHGLPTRGFVNYPEAQALMRRLEAWSQHEAADTAQAAVLALYEGQAVLLRRLVEQSEILRARRHPLEISLPSRLHQRECDVVFLSLTRSHPQRATAFGQDVRELPIALTRARSRLFVFGDPAALSKRIAFHGPVDPHDAHAAQQECDHLARLLAWASAHLHNDAKVNGVANGNAPSRVG